MMEDYYKQKTWCDAKDGLGVWRLGRIKKRVKSKVLVYFDGWSDRWKQWYCIHSSLIAPIRMHSRGYTGQSKLALREWEFSEDNLRMVETKLKLLMHNELTGFSAYDMTVLLRGDLFVLIDSILTFTFPNPDQEVPRVFEFLGLIVDLLCMWLGLVPGIFSAADLERENSYLADVKTALYESHHELVEMLTSVLGYNQRTAKFYAKYSQCANTRTLINNFFKKNGIKALTSILQSTVPIEVVWKLIVVTPTFFSVATPAAIERYFASFEDALLGKLDTMTADSLACVLQDKALVMRFMENLEYALSLVHPDAAIDSKLQFVRVKLKQPSYKRSLGLDSLDDPLPSGLPSARASSRSRTSTRRTSYKEFAVPQLDFMPSVKKSTMPAPVAEEEPVTSQVVDELKDLIEARFQACVALIQARAPAPEPVELGLDIVFRDHKSCDAQEFAVLSAIEYSISENRLEEAMKLLRWRKKILKIAGQSGWEVANEVAKSTLQRLDVRAEDLIEANLKRVLNGANAL